MPLAHPSHVVSFSSEDPHHPASNLLNRETFRKWKCKEVGEKEAFVILRFDKAETINCIDIGNDGSALVEVSVARSGNGGEPNFEVLLSSTAFISPLDSREGKNLNGVKSFSANSLSKPIASQKWDLVKVQVSQPFNRHVQYGLTFIKFMVAADPNEPQKIGMFGLRKAIGGEDSDDDDLRPGSLFSRKLTTPKHNADKSSAPKPSPSLSTNASIREASTKLANASKAATDADVKDLLSKSKLDLPSPSSSGSRQGASRDITPLLNKKQLPDTPIRPKDKDKSKTNGSATSQNPTVVSSSPSASKSTSKKKRALSPDPPSNTRSSPSTSKGAAGTPAKKQKKVRKTKPFNKLFEGVIFSMSGFENPLRGQLRDKAIEMGARYKADWDRSCTHLICAFYNTPKFQQVKRSGNGHIVKKDWIEKSHANKCRYPWRRHCLDKQDQGSDSEEEIHAEQNDEEEVLDESGTAEENETNNDDNVSTKTKRKRVLVVESSDEDEKSDGSKDAYNADTDVDEDRTPDLSPSLMDAPNDVSSFFENISFCLDKPSSNSQNNSTVESIITKHKGKIHQTPKDSTEYFVCHTFDWKDDFADALSDNPNLVFVHKNWIIECDQEDHLVEKDSFMLSPS